MDNQFQPAQPVKPVQPSVPPGPVLQLDVPPAPPKQQPAAPVPNKKSKKKLLLMLLVILVVLVLVGGGIVALASKPKPKAAGPAPLDCAPPSAPSVDKSMAIGLYEAYVSAIKLKNQSCVNTMTSGYFTHQQATAFPNANGKWITSQGAANLPSVVDRLANVSTAMDETKFAVAAYTRPVDMSAPAGEAAVAPPTGLTLSYPVSLNNIPYELQISFVSDSNKVVVDNLAFMPVTAKPKASAPQTTKTTTKTIKP